MTTMRSVGAVLLCSVVVLGCSGGKPPASGEVAKGRELCRAKDCLSCHSVDGKKSDGPTFKGMYSAEKSVSAKGFPPCPAVEEGSFTEAEAAVVIRFIKSLR